MKKLSKDLNIFLNKMKSCKKKIKIIKNLLNSFNIKLFT